MTATSVAALAAIGMGLAVLWLTVRPRVTPAAAVAGTVLLLGGTSVGAAVAPAADARAGLAFFASALAVAAAARTRSPAASLPVAALLLAAALGFGVGADVGRLESPRLSEALFSSRHGLLFWNPVLWAGLLGWPLLWRLDRPWARVLLAGLGVGVGVVSACPPAESGPWAARRFTPLVPLIAPALFLAMDAVRKAVARAPERMLAAAGALLIAWNLLLTEQYRSGLVPRDGTVSFPAVAENSAALVSRLAGSPPAWPANWAFAWRHGLPLDRYDLVAGKRLAGEGPQGKDIDIGEPALDAALLLEGWSVRHPCGAAVCRAVDGRARLLAPVERGGPFEVAVEASGVGWLSVSVNGVWLGQQPLAEAQTSLRFAAAGGWAKLNELTLTLAPGGRALVDRVRLAPRGGAS